MTHPIRTFCGLKRLLPAMAIPILLTGCAAAQTAAPQDQPWPLVFRRTGGIAGFDETLTVRANGLTRWDSNGQVTEFRLDENVQMVLQSELEAARFRRLPQTVPEPPQGADLFFYSITFDDHKISFHDGEVPADIEPVLNLINEIIANHVEQ